MFCVVAITDVDVLKKICKECGGEFNPACSMNLLFILNERPSGVAQMKFVAPNTISIDYVAVLKQIRGQGYGDFLTRSAINKVMDIAEIIEVNSVSDYFLKFNFCREGDKMVAKSQKIVFPSKCSGCLRE